MVQDWFIAQLRHLLTTEKSINNIPPVLKPRPFRYEAGSSSSLFSHNPGVTSTDSLAPLVVEIQEDALLPLNDQFVTRFDSILNLYQELSETYIFALRVEIRCHTMYYLDLAMREVWQCPLSPPSRTLTCHTGKLLLGKRAI